MHLQIKSARKILLILWENLKCEIIIGKYNTYIKIKEKIKNFFNSEMRLKKLDTGILTLKCGNNFDGSSENTVFE